MFQLSETLHAWQTEDFAPTLRREVRQLGAAQLPLQAGLRNSGYALDEVRDVTLLGVEETPEHIRVRLGIFYAGIIAGCSCADDPTPVEAQDEYCEIRLNIDKSNAAASAELLD
ncbi:MAG: hypothetical protein P8Y78_00075 [Acidihalobacter sp.]